MKKLLFVFVAALCFSFTAKAQLILGGGIGFGTTSDNKFSVYIAPEVGYHVSNYFSVGGKLSYQSGNNVFGIDPYVRGHFFKPAGLIRVMATVHAPFKFASNYFSCGCYFQPGISIRVANKARLELHVGAFGWGKVQSGDYVKSGWEAVVNGNTVTLGVVFDI